MDQLPGRQRALLRGRHRAGVCLPGQPHVLQIHLPGDGIFETDKLFFPPARQVRRGKMRLLRQVPQGLPDEREPIRQFPEERKCDRVHPLLALRGGMPEKGAEALKREIFMLRCVFA